MTVKYKVISGMYVGDEKCDKDFVCGIESFPEAQDIVSQKLSEFDYSYTEYYGHKSRDAV
jgi:hypothetical protein